MVFDLKKAGLAWFFVLGVLVVGCSEKSDCEKACSRLARCKLAARQGEAMMGERAPPPDAACMTKCQKQPDVFASCERKLRECDDLLACSGALW
jgi:Cys-rich protein (TIGR04453 family)